MKLYIVPLSYASKKLSLYINHKLITKFTWNKPLQVELKNVDSGKEIKVNLKEGMTKNHYFKLKANKDKLLYLKKNFDFFGTRLAISEDRKFKTLINWKNEINF